MSLEKLVTHKKIAYFLWTAIYKSLGWFSSNCNHNKPFHMCIFLWEIFIRTIPQRPYRLKNLNIVPSFSQEKW